MKMFLKVGGIIMMICGVVAVIASVEPSPNTSVWVSMLVAISGFIILWSGYRVYCQGDGEPFLGYRG